MVEAYKESALQFVNAQDIRLGEPLDLEHTATQLHDAVFDILNAYPEQGFYFFNERKFKSRVAFLKDQFMPDSNAARIAYAVKANPKRRIIQLLSSYGIDNFDCASPEEISYILEIVPDANILYNNPRKTGIQVKEASRLGTRHFTAHNQSGVEKILGNVRPYDSVSPLEIAVRMETLNQNAEINLSTKFGATPDEVRRITQFLVSETQVRPGIAVNTGSQNKNPEMFRSVILQIAEIIRDIREMVIVNLGGGFPVNYHESDNFDLQKYFELINETIKEVLHDFLKDENANVYIEPGRSVVADSVDMFVPVIEREDRHGQPCIGIADGIFTSFSDSVIHGWKYPFRAYSIDDKQFSEKTTSFTAFGQTCDSGDKLVDVELPENIDEGDYLWVPGAGAYFDSQASYFNGFRPHRYVFYNT